MPKKAVKERASGKGNKNNGPEACSGSPGEQIGSSRKPSGNLPKHGELMGVMSMETAEIFEVFSYDSRLHADIRDQHFVLHYQTAMASIKKRITDLTTYRVLDYFIDHMKFGNRLRVAQRALAAELGLQSHAKVNRALRWLEDECVIRRVGKDKHGVEYQVSAEYAWKGKSDFRGYVAMSHHQRRRAMKRPEHKAGHEPVFSCPEKATA